MAKTVFKTSPALKKAADIAVKEVLAVKEGEHVLIITNPEKDVYKIAQAMYVASLNADALPALVVQQRKTSFDYAEPPVIGAIKTEPPVIISISAERMGKDREALANPYKGKGGKTYSRFLIICSTRLRRFGRFGLQK